MSEHEKRLHLDDHLFPVEAFFNVLPDGRFLSIIEHLASGTGVDYNGVGCFLPGDDGEAPETGAEFYVLDKEVRITDTELHIYVTHAMQAYLSDHEEDRVAGEALLKRFDRLLS